MIFYLRSDPLTLDIMSPDQTPWVTDDRIAHDGLAMVCPVHRSSCLEAMDHYVTRYPAAKSEDVTLTRSYWGTHDHPVRYRIITILPRATGTQSGS
jgi:hypothetical protein